MTRRLHRPLGPEAMAALKGHIVDALEGRERHVSDLYGHVTERGPSRAKTYLYDALRELEGEGKVTARTEDREERAGRGPGRPRRYYRLAVIAWYFTVMAHMGPGSADYRRERIGPFDMWRECEAAMALWGETHPPPRGFVVEGCRELIVDWGQYGDFDGGTVST